MYVFVGVHLSLRCLRKAVELFVYAVVMVAVWTFMMTIWHHDLIWYPVTQDPGHFYDQMEFLSCLYGIGVHSGFRCLDSVLQGGQRSMLAQN